MNATKKQIRENSTLELTMRYNRLLLIGETEDAEDISIANAKELIWVEEELRKRAIKAVGHDFYPPPRLEKEKSPECNLSNERKVPYAKPEPPPQRKNIKELQKPQSQPKAALEISFKIQIITSLGTKAGEFRVLASSKDEAEKKARKMIWKMGLKGARCKIS